jgi:DNA-binding LytR/AlgR family response regulator
MKVVIIEDEKLSAAFLISLLHKIDADIEVIFQFDSIKTSVQAFQQWLHADLLFLDIRLADGLSFDILQTLSLDMPIIFTTAYDEYAIKAFKHNSIDYLLKPISLDDLNKAMDKFKKLNQQISQPQTSDKLIQAYAQMIKTYKNRFMVKSGQTIDSIKVEDIVQFQTQDSITFLIIANGKRFPVDYTLDQLEVLLSPTNFFRINRKVILNILCIKKVSTHLNSRLYIQSPFLVGDAAIVSRERVADFKFWLNH